MTEKNKTNKNYRTFVLVLLTIVYGFNFINTSQISETLSVYACDLGLFSG